MSVLSIDPGKRVGWCRSDGRNGVIENGRYADHGEAIAKFSEWLGDQFKTTPTLYLAIERPFFREGQRGADFVHGLIWTAHAVAFLHDVARHEETADHVRKWLLGRCRRRKTEGETEREFDAEIMAAVQARGFYPTSEHAADAAALLCFCEKIAVRVAA